MVNKPYPASRCGADICTHREALLKNFRDAQNSATGTSNEQATIAPSRS